MHAETARKDEQHARGGDARGMQMDRELFVRSDLRDSEMKAVGGCEPAPRIDPAGPTTTTAASTLVATADPGELKLQ